MSSFLVAQAVQVAVVFAIVLALDALVARRGGPRLRAALWAAFFVKLCVPPDLTSPVSVARVGEWFHAGDSGLAGPDPAPRAVGTAWLIAVWLVGASASFVLALHRLRSASREWARAARSAPGAAEGLLAELSESVGLRRVPSLRVRDDAPGAATVGLLAPVVVVPTGLLAEPHQLEHVLLHELGHVRRRDGLRSLAWTLARCVYWFHPAVHVAARRAALVRELACDEIAANRARDGVQGYRRTLVELARPLVAPAPLLAPFGAAGAMITARLERLARVRGHARRCEILPFGTFLLLCACCVPLGAAPAPASVTDVNSLEGCLRKRFLVLSELARQESAGSMRTLD